VKAQGCRRSGGPPGSASKQQPPLQVSSQLRQKVQSTRSVAVAGDKGPSPTATAVGSAPKYRHAAPGNIKAEGRRESGGQSDTAASGDSASQEGWMGLSRTAGGRKRGPPSPRPPGRPRGGGGLRGRGREEEGESSPPDESDSSDSDEEEEDSSYDSDEGHYFKAQPTLRDVTQTSSCLAGPTPSSVVRLEANQKARNKRERQELYASGTGGSYHWSAGGAEGDVKVRRKAPCRLSLLATTAKTTRRPNRGPGGTGEREGGERRGACGARPQEAAPRGGLYRRTPAGPATFPSTSERLKRATRKSTSLRGPVSKKRSWLLSGGPTETPRSQEGSRGRRCRTSQKGRAVSLLLESFAADEGFRMDDSSFSEGDEDAVFPYGHKSHAVPNCVLSRELLADGLKVLDVRPETETLLSEGTRVCALWSERSRCLYPGYVRRGSSSDEGKPGGLMVEFDDGDRGKISLHNIRLLPPGYQIHCECPSEDHPQAPRPQLPRCCPEDPRAGGFPVWSRASLETDPGTQASRPLTAKRHLSTREGQGDPRLNGLPKKTPRAGREDDPFRSQCSTPAKGLFNSSSFAVDSFSSIANGYSSFGSSGPVSGTPNRGGGAPYGHKRKQDGETGAPVRSKKSGQFLVKLDHEGVTSPKTKNSKALLSLGGSVFGSKGVGGVPRPEAYAHPVLLVKDNKKGGASQADLLLKGAPSQKKPSPSLALGEYKDLGFSSHRDCSFLSRLSVSSSSSGSSSSSSSGSLSSSSLCSSDNDSSYSSEEEESSALMLQSCLSSHRGLLRPHGSPGAAAAASGPHQRRSLVAKTAAASSQVKVRGPNDPISGGKPQKRKEYGGSASKPSSKEAVKRPRMLPEDDNALPRPKVTSLLSGQPVWKWSGSPTQRRGLKGKARKLFYKAVVRGRDTVKVGDCAVFLSAGRPHLPYVGRIESFWESWTSSMVVKVKWFYHPEETKLGKRHPEGKYALYQSSHEDENDVQTISHKCRVVGRDEYDRLTRGQRPADAPADLYCLAGTYDPTAGQLVTTERMSVLC
ncbi:hypothetical protein NHX12_031369, partial [Muraenolepis orangiensis]